MDLGIHIDRGEFTISGGFVPKRTGFWGMMYRARADLTMLLGGLLIVGAGRSKDAEFRHGGRLSEGVVITRRAPMIGAGIFASTTLADARFGLQLRRPPAHSPSDRCVSARAKPNRRDKDQYRRAYRKKLGQLDCALRACGVSNGERSPTPFSIRKLATEEIPQRAARNGSSRSTQSRSLMTSMIGNFTT